VYLVNIPQITEQYKAVVAGNLSSFLLIYLTSCLSASPDIILLVCKSYLQSSNFMRSVTMMDKSCISWQ
jgi:hypothetical protein